MKKILIAVVVMVTASVVVYMLFFRSPDINKTVADAFSPYPNQITTSSRSDADAETQLEKIMALYDSKKYQAALGGFENYLKSNPDKYEVQFYRGIVYLKMDQGAQAVTDFQQVVNNNKQFKKQAEWYLCLSYLKNNQKKEAADLIQRIADERDHPFYEKANTILSTVAYRNYVYNEIEAI